MSTPLNVLILEDNATIADMVRMHIDTTFPDVLPLVARSLGEANVLTYQYEFAVFIIDLGLPDGSGAEFIGDVKTVFPEANFIVMTGMSPVECRRQIAHFGNIPIIEKPFDVRELAAILNPLLPQPEIPSEEFRGSFRRLRLVDLIQVKCLGLDTCRITISNPEGGVGVIGFQRGTLHHAEVKFPTGLVTGKAAFGEMLKWKNGSFQEQEFDPETSRNIDEPWEIVLLNAVRLSEEFSTMEVS